MFSSESSDSYLITLFIYAVSFVITLCCMFIKMPQIVNIFKAKKSKSVSLLAVLFETCGHTIILVYHFAKNYPLSSYSEYVFLVPQDLILISILLYYNDLLDVGALIGFVVYMFSSISLASGIVPNVILKIAIIYSLHQSKDVGQLSLTTWLATTICSTARLLTSLYKTGDIAVSFNFLCSIILNTVIMSQIYYYKRTNRKVKLP